MRLVADFADELDARGCRPDGWVHIKAEGHDTLGVLEGLQKDAKLRLEVDVGNSTYKSTPNAAASPDHVVGDALGLAWHVRLSYLGRFTMADRVSRPPGGVTFRLVRCPIDCPPADWHADMPGDELAATTQTWTPGWNRLMAVVTTFAALPLTLITIFSAPETFDLIGDDKISSTLIAAATLLGVSTAQFRKTIKQWLHRLDIALPVLLACTVFTADFWSRLVVVNNLSPIATQAAAGHSVLPAGSSRLALRPRSLEVWNSAPPPYAQGQLTSIDLDPSQTWLPVDHTGYGAQASVVQTGDFALTHAAYSTHRIHHSLPVAGFLRLAKVLGFKNVSVHIGCKNRVPLLFLKEWRASQSCYVQQGLQRKQFEIATTRHDALPETSADSEPVEEEGALHQDRYRVDLTWRAGSLKHVRGGPQGSWHNDLSTLLARRFIQLEPNGLGEYGFVVTMEGSGLLARVEARQFDHKLPTPTRTKDQSNGRVGMRFYMGDAAVGELEVWGRLGTALRCTSLLTTAGQVAQLKIEAWSGSGEQRSALYTAVFHASNPSLTRTIPLCLPKDAEGNIHVDSLELKLARGFVPDSSWRLTLPTEWTLPERLALYAHNDARLGILHLPANTPPGQIGPLPERTFSLPHRATVCAEPSCPSSGQRWRGNPTLSSSKEWFWWHWNTELPERLFLKGGSAVLRRDQPLGDPEQAYRLSHQCGPCYLSITGVRYAPGTCETPLNAAEQAAREATATRFVPCCRGVIAELCPYTPETR